MPLPRPTRSTSTASWPTRAPAPPSGRSPGQILVIGGQTPDNDGSLCRGQISAVYLWASARTADQVLADAALVLPERDATFCGYWGGAAIREPSSDADGPDSDWGMASLAFPMGRLSMRSTPHSLVLAPTSTAAQWMTIPPSGLGLGDFTFEAWVRAAAPGMIVAGAPATALANTVELAVIEDGSLVFGLWSETTKSRVLHQTSPLGLLGNTWHHVAAIRSAGVLALVGAGEIVHRSPHATLGYYKDEAMTAAAFRNGWFHSGDLGVMSQDGVLGNVCRAGAGADPPCP